MKIEEEIYRVEFRNKNHKSAVNVIYTFNWLFEKHMELLKPFGLTIPQFNILRILRGQSPLPANIKLLKKRMMDKMSDASRLVEKLRIKGLVERRICDKDRRNVDVLITEAGLKLLKEIDRKENEFDKLTANLTSEEMDQLNYLLDKLRG